MTSKRGTSGLSAKELPRGYCKTCPACLWITAPLALSGVTTLSPGSGSSRLSAIWTCRMHLPPQGNPGGRVQHSATAYAVTSPIRLEPHTPSNAKCPPCMQSHAGGMCRYYDVFMLGVYRPSHLKELHCCSTLTFNDHWWQVVLSHCSQAIFRTLPRWGSYAAYHFYALTHTPCTATTCMI